MSEQPSVLISSRRPDAGEWSLAKAIVVGSVLSFFISVGAPYGNMVLHGSYMAIDFSTPGAIFLFFVVALLLNSYLRVMDRLHPGGGGLVLRAASYAVVLVLGIGICYLILSGLPVRECFSSEPRDAVALLFQWRHRLAFLLILLVSCGAGAFWAVSNKRMALARAELLVAFVMMIIASAITTMGLTEQLLPIIPAMKYYGADIAEWKQNIYPHVDARPWITLQDDLAIKYFYEGLPKEGGRLKPIPWTAWTKPLLYWGIFLMALYFVMMCMMNILRRQWVENERLVFPLTRLPLAVAEGEASGQIVNPFFKNRLMWLGFAIPVIVSSFKGLHSYFPGIPSIDPVKSVLFTSGWPAWRFRLSFPMVGFTYLVNLDVAFSLWFFNLVFWVLRGIFVFTGVTLKENLGGYGTAGNAIMAHLGMGAMVVFVLYGLWTARTHLRAVFRKAIGRGREVDDSGELMPYWASFWGMIGGLLVMSVWLWKSGLPLWIVPIFLFWIFLIFIGLTRVVAEGGVAATVAPSIGSVMTTSTVGCSALGPAGLTALAFTWIWSADIRTFVMASYANAMKIGSELSKRRHVIFWASLLAVVLSIAASCWMVMRLAYIGGGVNMNSWFFRGGCKWPFEYAQRQISMPTTMKDMFWGRTCNTIGAVVMFGLMIARHSFTWWPLHPIGFAIGTVWMMDQLWLSIAIAWVIKVLILKYGGPRLFRRLRPFFLGLICGQFAIAGFWLIIDFFTLHDGNMVFWA